MLNGAYAWPSFTGGAILSARQINTLAAIADDVRSRGMASGIAYKLLTAQSSRSVDGYVFHKHDASDVTNEKLYYHVQVSDAEGGGGAAAGYLYYKDMTTPLVTFPATNATYKVLADLGTWPTGDHPADGERVRVRITPAAGWRIVVNRVEEILLPTGYTALDDAAALTNDATAASVPTDLQTVSDNLAALSAVTVAPLQAFRPHVQVAGDDLIGLAGQANPVTYWLLTNLGDTLYYQLGVFMHPTLSSQSVTVTVASGAVTLATITHTDYNDYKAPHVYEGGASLAGVSRAMNALVPITVTTTWSSGGGDGSCGCYVMYLREGV